METVISLEYNELIREGEFEMKSQIQDFLDSKVDEWKFSVTTHLWCDHYFRLLRRHFSLQLLVENPGEEPVCGGAKVVTLVTTFSSWCFVAAIDITGKA